jgi:L-ascorbate metabolism protein UlaG (beta-lactamase superfamily)
MPISFRWLGVAGIELETAGQVLLIDPYLTRIPLCKTFFGRIQPDMEAVQSVEKCDYILVTHSHFDHLLDVAPIVLKTGAIVTGSYNTRQLLVSLGVSADLLQTVHLGDRLWLEEFDVRVFPFEHARIPGFNPGPLPGFLHPPLRARDYRMDFGCCYHISAAGVRFLTDPGINPSVDLPTDILFTQPYHNESYYRKLLDAIQPKVVIPIHWDSIFRRNDARPYFSPPAFKWPPLRRINLQAFARMIRQVAPDAEVIIPQPSKKYDFADFM